MGVGSAVCRRVEGARCVEDGLRRSARKEEGGGVSLSSGALVQLQNGGWGAGWKRGWQGLPQKKYSSFVAVQTRRSKGRFSQNPVRRSASRKAESMQ
jgi:hypothetical protein